MIYIYTPATSVSGGPELLQQLCHTLVKQGNDAKMIYFWSWFHVDPKLKVKERYLGYENDYTKTVIDSKENIVIVPETATYLLQRFRKAKKVIWWLSVDFYEKSLHTRKRKLNTVWGMLDKSISEIDAYHFCQSYYAMEYVKKFRIPNDRIFMVSDYLNKEFIENAKEEYKKEKEDIILYNPKKGIEFTQQIINITPSLNWVPIINMTPKEVRELMQKSKLYIDFGNHPGKDRLPREAAISGCCILTGQRGSAGNAFDIRVPEKYKIDEKTVSCETIAEIIISILENYNVCRKDFDIYRKIILSEEKLFETEVKEIFSGNKLCQKVLK